MTIRSQALLSVLFLATALTASTASPGPADGHPAKTERLDPTLSYTTAWFLSPPGSARGPATVGLPTGRGVVVYSIEPDSLSQPIASPRAPFVNVFALYHRQPCDSWTCLQQPLSADLEDLFELGLASSAGASAPEALAIGSRAREIVGSHFLLNGQKTALLAPGAPAREAQS